MNQGRSVHSMYHWRAHQQKKTNMAESNNSTILSGLSSSFQSGKNNLLKTLDLSSLSSMQTVVGARPLMSWFSSSSPLTSVRSPVNGGDKSPSEKECRQVFFDCA